MASFFELARNLRELGTITLDVRPRPIIPGRTYLITRRCTQRQFWLLPCKETDQIIRYCVAYAAETYGIQVHAICANSNHWHAVVTDPQGRLPRFLHWVHLHVAKCLNARYERWENLWSSEQASVVILTDDQSILDKITYCLANPVADGLVSEGAMWPGVRTSPRGVAGMECEVRRPSYWFRADGPMPETVKLRLTRPAICPKLSDEQLAREVEKLVLEAEAEAREKRKTEGKGFLGLKGLRRQKPWQRPNNTEPRRKLTPRVAGKDNSLRRRMLDWVKRFVKGHGEARRAWQAGDREVEFPAGTYAMRVFHGVRCAPYVPP